MVNNLMRFKILSIPPIPTLPPNKPELKRQNCYDGTKHSHKNNCINTLNEVIDKIISLERKDQHEISIRPHPHEFYLYFDV